MYNLQNNYEINQLLNRRGLSKFFLERKSKLKRIKQKTKKKTRNTCNSWYQVEIIALEICYSKERDLCFFNHTI